MIANGRRHTDMDDAIEQHRAMGYTKAESARRLMAPLDLIEHVWAQMDAAAADEDRVDKARHGKRGAA